MDKIIEEYIEDWSILRYDELPDFELYIDQLIHVAESQAKPLSIVKSYQPLTSSMVNNYVKKGIIPAPKKKRYTREQLSILIVIAFLKSVYSIDEIKQGLDIALERKSQHSAYGEFCDSIERGIKNYFLNIQESPSTNNCVLFYACESIASKLYVQYFLENIEETEDLRSPILQRVELSE